MAELDYLLAALIMAAVTFGLRAFPFVARGFIAHHRRIQVLGRRLPVAMMVLLTLYAMGVHNWSSPADGRAQMMAVAVVAVLQWWRRQALLSILAGTLVYMTLMNGWFGL
ncbi:branched-subunit amino acid transport protein AzlD [Oceanisphaera litoralis]|uniref:branched-chain amino acid transporter permease n=1 Tax=Oceanisphaera litoralis TaxID=225144 RepID=UPI0019583CE3|nr:AzlD domain-containing protein [Oceanisphaera litoralis]MBM7456658.1 branched-subunit amino acid transport protein AzlD [Oceanisphaera litoralis]